MQEAIARVERLAELREAQRRQMRAIPKELFQRLRWDDPPASIPPEIDSIDLETSVRTTASGVLTSEACNYLEGRVTGTAAGWCRKAAAALAGDYIHEAKLAIERMTDEQAPDTINETDHPINKSMLEFVVLLAMAEQIADDGYVDSRLPAAK